ncbi:type IV pilin biogenesis protein [Pantoea rodasii]|uniref:Type IV pilin biogenesis protein n=1 Tax=Pantoea rodasii TaxID=1076549 RepID=A0A2M9W5D8_9GAMM|nr:protein transport protein HofC [Pantoea rodasii]ORM64099.1 type IV pilin biogenesis protein [Pantoea rodasii]PJZ02766.1 type IV pilin biogenesis protein [Pantoea rodasii]
MANLYLFRWQALDTLGALLEGNSLVASQDVLLAQLSDRGMLPVSWQQGKCWRNRDWKWQQKIDLVRQLSTLLKAGLPLAESLTLLAEGHPHAGWRVLLEELQRRVMAGEAFSSALRAWPHIFPPLFPALMEVGELTGQLDECCRQLALQQSKQQHLRQKVVKALRYPFFILLVALAVSAGMLLFVLPEFVAVYASFDAPLPAFTAAVMSLSAFLQQAALPLMILMACVVLGGRWLYCRSVGWQKRVHQWLLRLPLLATLWRGGQLSQIYAILQLTQQAGLTLLQSLQAVEVTLASPLWREAVMALQKHIAAGAPLHQALQHHALFTPLCAQLIRVGEEAGALDVMLARLAEWHEAQTLMRADALAASLEPLMMVVIGGIVGTLVIAMYLPVFGLGDAIR